VLTSSGENMYAIELNAVINNNHEIYLKLPDTVHAKTAKVIVMYENNNPPVAKKRLFGQFRDKIKIADDFDDELPLEFWLGNPS
jgi:hypothetical protein